MFTVGQTAVYSYLPAAAPAPGGGVGWMRTPGRSAFSELDVLRRRRRGLGGM